MDHLQLLQNDEGMFPLLVRRHHDHLEHHNRKKASIEQSLLAQEKPLTWFN